MKVYCCVELSFCTISKIILERNMLAGLALYFQCRFSPLVNSLGYFTAKE